MSRTVKANTNTRKPPARKPVTKRVARPKRPVGVTSQISGIRAKTGGCGCGGKK